MQQQKLKQQHEEERKRRQQVEKSFISTNNTKISKSATLIAAANAGKIAVGPIPLEIARNNMSTPPTQQQAPIPPYPSPNLQRKDNNLGNLSTLECFQMKMHSVKSTSNSYKTLAHTIK